jgi:hypothetical protein
MGFLGLLEFRRRGSDDRRGGGHLRYLFFNSLSLATGGNALPIGRPTLKG